MPTQLELLRKDEAAIPAKYGPDAKSLKDLGAQIARHERRGTTRRTR